MRLVFLAFLIIHCLNAQNAAIEGTTLNKLNGNPLGGVHVFVFSGGSNGTYPTAYGAISDKQGHFSLPPMPAGTYFYDAEYTGFVCLINELGAAPISTLIVKAGEQISDLKVELAPQAVISGKVVDEFGDPISGVRTQLENLLGNGSGSSTPRSAHEVTGSLGEFHWIVGPGKYRIKVSPEQSMGLPPEIRDGVPLPDYGVAYYPGVSEAERASLVEVKPGDMAVGLEIRMSRNRGIMLSGTVSGMPAGAQFVSVILRFGSDPQSLIGIKQTRVTEGGRYQFTGLAPGYVSLNASVYSESAPLASGFVERKIDGDTSIDLAMSPGIDCTGKVEAPQDLPTKGRKVRFEPIGIGNTPQPAEIEAEGMLQAKHVMPGRYKVVISPLPDDAYVKSAQLDTATSSSDEVEIVPGGSTQLKITLATDGGRIAGRVLDQEGEAIPGSTGIVILSKGATIQVDMRNTARFTPEGQYSFKGVRPGKYRLLAVDFARSGFSGNIASMMKLAAEKGEEVEVPAGGRITHDIRVIGKEALHAKP